MTLPLFALPTPTNGRVDRATLRILPGLDTTAIVSSVHHWLPEDGRERMAPCTRPLGHPAHLCEWCFRCNQAWQRGDTQEGRRLKQFLRFTMLVVDRDHPERGVQIAKFGRTVVKPMFDQMNDLQDLHPPWSPLRGRDWSLRRTLRGGGRDIGPFPVYEGSWTEPLPLGRNTIADAWLDSRESLIPHRSFIEEVETLMDRLDNGTMQAAAAFVRKSMSKKNYDDDRRHYCEGL